MLSDYQPQQKGDSFFSQPSRLGSGEFGPPELQGLRWVWPPLPTRNIAVLSLPEGASDAVEGSAPSSVFKHYLGELMLEPITLTKIAIIIMVIMTVKPKNTYMALTVSTYKAL